jgi:hypothetical protein
MTPAHAHVPLATPHVGGVFPHAGHRTIGAFGARRAEPGS